MRQTHKKEQRLGICNNLSERELIKRLNIVKRLLEARHQTVEVLFDSKIHIPWININNEISGFRSGEGYVFFDNTNLIFVPWTGKGEWPNHEILIRSLK